MKLIEGFPEDIIKRKKAKYESMFRMPDFA